MLVEFENVILIGGIFYNWGQMGANVLVEFENVFLIGGIFFLKLGAKNNFGIEKISYFGNYLNTQSKVNKKCLYIEKQSKTD